MAILILVVIALTVIGSYAFLMWQYADIQDQLMQLNWKVDYKYDKPVDGATLKKICNWLKNNTDITSTGINNLLKAMEE